MKIPSKKISITILITAAIVTAIIVIDGLLDKKNTTPSQSAGSELLVKNSLDNLEDKDTDGDGLFDWEESLWGTDPNNVDTDGDGTSDQQEILEDRNPIIAGPDDQNTTTEEDIVKRFNEVIPETAGLSKEFVSNFLNSYFSMKDQSTGSLSYTQKEQLIQKITNDALEMGTIDDKYNKVSLLVFNDIDNKEKLANYIESIVKIEKKYKAEQNNINTGNYYAGLAAIFERMSEDLMGVVTPINMTEFQTNLANAYYKLSVATLWIKSDSDPVLGLRGISLFYDSMSEISKNWGIIIQFIKNNDIIYDGTDFVI